MPGSSPEYNTLYFANTLYFTKYLMKFRKGQNCPKNGTTGTRGLLSCSSTKHSGYIYCIYITLYFIHMQDACHVFLCRLLLHDLLSFMSQSRTVGNIIYFITTYIIENNVPKTHKITKNAYTSVLREN